MNKSYVARTVIEIDPSDSPQVYAPQSVVVKGKRADGRSFKVDIGRVCYLDRERDSKRTSGGKHKSIGGVCSESLSHERVSWIRNYLNRALRIGWREETLRGKLHYVRYFFEFCDFNGGLKPTELTDLLKEYNRYAVFLDQRRRFSGPASLGSTAYNGRLTSARSFIQWAYELSNNEMLKLIPKHRQRKVRAKESSAGGAISLEDGHKYLRACIDYFNKFSTAILDNKYPVNVSPPDTTDRHLYWHSPRGVTLKSLPGCFDADGTPLPEEDIIHIIEKNFKSKNRWEKGFYKATLVTNRNAWISGDLTFHKVYAYNLSAFCFFQLYLGLTGANIQPTLDLRISDINLDKIGSRSFAKKHKFRSGRRSKFNAPSQLKKELLKFLRLREWVESIGLKGDVEDYLFVKIGEDQFLKRLERDCGGWIATQSPLFKGISMISSREIRRLAGEFFIRRSHGKISLVAKKLDNSVTTVAAAYTGVDLESQHSEMNVYHEELADKINMFNRSATGVVEVKVAVDLDAVRISSGACLNVHEENPNRAEGFNEHAPQPSCGTFESCLFCDFFAMHKDSEDIHKILSLRKALSLASVVRNDPEHHEAVVQPALFRIDEILTFMSSLDDEISRIISEVERVIDAGVYSSRWQDQIHSLENHMKNRG